MTDFENMSDEEVIALYHKSLEPDTYSFCTAGMAAGFLVTQRGYMIKDGDRAEFVKEKVKEKKSKKAA